MASTDARPVPEKNVAYRHYFAIRKNDGSLITTWAGQDSELSKDGGNYVDATSEATEIQTSGTGYIDLTSGEMNYDCVVLKVTVTNADALTYIVALFPEESGDIRVNATQVAGGTQSATDLKDFADAGYDPATNKVQGVVLVDTTTTNTDMVGTNGANTTVPDAAGTAPTAAENRQEMDSNSMGLEAIFTDTDITIPALIAALNNISPAQVNTQADLALADYDGPTNAEMEARTLATDAYATLAKQITIQKTVECDVGVDRTTTPWEAVYYERGTSTELFRKKLTQADGTNVTSDANLIGNYLE